MQISYNRSDMLHQLFSGIIICSAIRRIVTLTGKKWNLAKISHTEGVSRWSAPQCGTGFHWLTQGPIMIHSRLNLNTVHVSRRPNIVGSSSEL